MIYIRASFALLVCCACGCLTGRTRSDFDELSRESSATETALSHGVAAANADDDALSRVTDLDTILRIALTRNPDLGEARERFKAALARVPASARLPDLEFKYEQWAVPLSRPWALNESSTLMFGLRQSFPAPGSLAARSRQALEDAHLAASAERVRQLDLARDVRRAYYDFYRADREYKIHLEHVDLALHLVELAREHYQAGRGTQQDVLRTIVELSRLHEDIAAIEQQLVSARALLNALMARPLDAPLGAPPDVSPSTIEVRVADLAKLMAHRPELVSAEHAVKRSEAAAGLAKSVAYWPSFMVGADYWYQPTAVTPAPTHAYGAMVAITLPWLNPAHREELEAAEHTLAADRRALESLRNTTAFQVRDAAARLDAARYSFRIIDHDLFPQAQQSFESARAAYTTGSGGDALALIDSLRSYLQVRLDRHRALALMQSSLADLERAVGADLDKTLNRRERP
jgi:outer membrane protein TolC